MEKRKINFYLLRHGETDWNRSNLIQGNQDIFLNENGLRQAKKIAEFLKNTKIDRVFSSKLNRAYQTGKIIADSKNIVVEKVDGLQEISFGEEEGGSKLELRKKYGNEFYEEFFHSAGHMDFLFKNGESKRSAGERFSAAVFNILNAAEYADLLIISHGFVIPMFFILNGLPFPGALKNCGLIGASYENGAIKNIRILN
ncbi:MAG: histidine phosphatase family protein [Rickettsiales bacterium]|jgi:broad specificity phosphatase PhoE|nr:histidine phosphatase family protein [Rickettsiales bacterium]